MKRSQKRYKRRVSIKLKDWGEVDDEKRLILVNPRKGDLLNTILHEELHFKYPNAPESWVVRKALQQEKALTLSQAQKLLRKYQRKYKRRKNVRH